MTFIVDTPGAYNLDAWQGSVFTREFTVTGENLTGYLARMQVRKSALDTAKLVSIDSDQLGGIAWTSASTGVLTVTISAVVLAAAGQGAWVYDLELVPPDNPTGWIEASATKLLAGKFTVHAEVTK